MGLLGRAIGKGVGKVLNSDAVHGLAGAAADALDASGAGGRAGGVVSGVIRDRDQRARVGEIATGLAVPGVRNKLRAGRAARDLVQGVRGGAGAISSGPSGQFGHLPPPPGSGSVPAWDAQIPGSGSVPAWDAQIPGSGSHQSGSTDWDIPDWDKPSPPPGRSSQNKDAPWIY